MLYFYNPTRRKSTIEIPSFDSDINIAKECLSISAEMVESDDETKLENGKCDDKGDVGETILANKASGLASDVSNAENLNRKGITESTLKGNFHNSDISEGMDNNDYL